MARAGIIALAVVAFAVAGVAAFFATGTTSGGSGPVACGSDQKCIPTVSGDAVVAVLEERGFECELGCELTVGDIRYRINVGTPLDGREADMVTGYSVEVTHDPIIGLSGPAMNLFTWFAVLPFADDEEADAVSREWLTDHIGGEHDAEIRGYHYGLATVEQPVFEGVHPGVLLTVAGAPPIDPNSMMQEGAEPGLGGSRDD